MAASPLPVGTVTFLFTDIEGSTRLLARVGTSAYTRLLDEHQAIMRDAVAGAGGHEIKTEGDSFFVVFSSAAQAVAAAVEAQRGLHGHDWPDGAVLRVRMGLHTGEGVTAHGRDYVGLDVHRAARIAAVGHGGQVLLSSTTRALVHSVLPRGVTLRDLGDHRLKDLTERERIADLVIDGLPSTFPTLRSLDATPNNLPTQLTSFLGRAREMAEIGDLLATTRLLTLTGPGGTGKTRLALQVAATLAERYPDGVYFVPLAPISDPALVPATIAQELGLADRGGRAPLERLVEHLADRHVFLVLDNFEQITDAAPVVSRLLADAPGIGVLVTSRSPLHLYGEREYPVPPLTVPDVRHLPSSAALGQFEAVALFVARASAVRPDFAVTNENAPAIAEICYRLDGLPLALELAAARVRLLTPQAILSRLDSRLDMLGGGARDLPDRQRTLRGAIAWSHDMLDADERSLFGALSVFVRGAPIEAIEFVAGDVLDGDVLDVLESLVNESLVRQSETRAGDPRFWMLETIRDYAAERLAESGRQPELRGRHARFYVRLAESARSHVMAPDNRAWLDRLEVEHDNIRAGVHWAIENGEAEVALRFIGSLWRFWQMRGYLNEAFGWARETLALPTCPKEGALRLDGLEAAGGLAYWSGDFTTAEIWYGEALQLQRDRGDVAGEANAAYNLLFTYLYRDDPMVDEALKLATEARDLFRRVGDRQGEARALWAIANCYYRRAEADPAISYAEQALPIFRAANDGFMIAWTLYLIAYSRLLRPDATPAQLAESEREVLEALDIFTQAQDVSGYTLVLDAVAAIAWLQGDRLRAAAISGAVAALERLTGTGLTPGNRELIDFDPKTLRTAPDTAAAFAEGERMPLEDALRYARGDARPASEPVAARSS